MWSSLFIAYYTLVILSLILGLYVFFSLLRLGSFKSSFTILLLFLHGSLILEIITQFPYAYTYSSSLCSGMEYLHIYFSFMNILVIALLVEAHRSVMLKDYFGSRALILKYGVYFIVLFPLITALAFIGNAYETISTSSDPWCKVKLDDTIWSIPVYSFWVWFFIIVSVLSTLYSFCRIYKSDHLLATKFFSSIGLYVFIALGSWLPRAVQRVIIYTHPDVKDDHFLSSLPYVLAGILYALIYLRERRFISLFSENESDARYSLSWEHADLSDFDRSLRHTRHTSATVRTFSGSYNPFLNFYPRQSSVELSNALRMSQV